MKNTIVLLSFKFLVVVSAMSQPDVREQVYVHLNSPMFVAGETMHFAAYCNSQLTGRPSALSKILYVEIVGEDGPVHQQKIDLNEGRGDSRFFISSDIPSGQYYLLAYTRWMKNFEDYFQCPVLIVNPYEEYAHAPEPVEDELQLFPLHDPLVAGVENIIAFNLKVQSPSQYKGRIVSSAGEVMSDFQVNTAGLGKLALTPQKGQSYQIILEDSLGNINFHRLPAVGEDGSFIVYEESRRQLSFKLHAANKTMDSLLLSLSDGNILYQERVVPHTSHRVSKEHLPVAGIYSARYSTNEGEVVAERSIFVSDAKPALEYLNKSYGTREQVTVAPQLDDGDYSISVRKKADLKLDGHQHAVWSGALQRLLTSPVPASKYLSSGKSVDIEAFMLLSRTHSITETPEQVGLLPEVREEILTGQITDDEGKPAAGEKVALTFPGEYFQLRISESNAQGDFIIPFHSSDSDIEAIVTALDFDKQLNIEIGSSFLHQYPDFNYQLPFLDSASVRKIIERSVRVQLENAYFDFLPVSEEASQWAEEIPYHTVYRLDDYRRFRTLKETFIEFIPNANVRENRDHVVKTTYFPGFGQAGYPPLVLLDGMPISGDRVIQLSPYRVESIGVLPNRYFLGPMVIDGIVGIKTFDQEYGDFQLTVGSNHKRTPVLGISRKDSYGFPDYSQNIDSHIADQRDQLYWEPVFRPSQNQEVVFYTSDVVGAYEIVIEGFTESGDPVTKVYDFWVE